MYELSTTQCLRHKPGMSPNSVCIRACDKDDYKIQNRTRRNDTTYYPWYSVLMIIILTCSLKIVGNRSVLTPYSTRVTEKIMCTSCAHVPILPGFGNLRKAWKSVHQNSSCFFVRFAATLSCILGRPENDTPSIATAFALRWCSEAALKADWRLLLCTACVCKLSLHPLQRCDMLCKSCTVAVYMEVCNNRCTVFSELPTLYCATLNLNKISWVRPLRTSHRGVYNLNNASCLVPPRFSDTATNAKCHICYCNLGCDTAVDSIACRGYVENPSPCGAT